MQVHFFVTEGVHELFLRFLYDGAGKKVLDTTLPGDFSQRLKQAATGIQTEFMRDENWPMFSARRQDGSAFRVDCVGNIPQCQRVVHFLVFVGYGLNSHDGNGMLVWVDGHETTAQKFLSWTM